MLTINPPGTTYRHTRARYHLVYTRVYTLSLSLSLFPSFSFRAPFLSLSLALPRSISPSLSARSLHSSATSVRHKRAACAHAPLFLSLSLPLSPLAGLVLYTTIVRPLIWFPHSIFVSLGSIVSFAPSEACRPHPNPLCISPLLCAATSSSSPLPLFDSLSAGLSFTLQRASLSLPTPPTPDTRHPIPNYVKRFRILRPDYAASLPSRDSSLSLPLSLSLSLSHTLRIALPSFVAFSRSRSRSPSIYPSRSLVTAHACLQKGFVAASVHAKSSKIVDSGSLRSISCAHFRVPPQFLHPFQTLFFFLLLRITRLWKKREEEKKEKGNGQ